MMHSNAQAVLSPRVTVASVSSMPVGPSSTRDDGLKAKENKPRPARLLAVLIFCAALVPTAAQAAPILYSINGGSAFLTVVVNGVVIGSTVSNALTGSLTIDQSAQALDAFNIVLDSNIALSLTNPYGGYDSVVIESASIAGGIGYSSATIASTGSSFTVSGGPLDVNGTYGASDSLGVSPPASGIPIAYTVPSITAVVTSTSSVSFTGFTLNSLSGATFSEPDDLTILATILIDPSVLTVIPEPSTALLASLGLALLAAGSRRQSD